MARKTVDVEGLKNYANHLLGLPEDEFYITADYKAGVCVMIEKVLLTSGNYNGYSYLNDEDCELGSFGFYSRKYA